MLFLGIWVEWSGNNVISLNIIYLLFDLNIMYLKS